MSLKIVLLAFLSLLAFNSDADAVENCAKKAELFAVAKEKKLSPKKTFRAKNTVAVTDLEVLKANGIKKDEVVFSTEIHDAEGAFVAYDVIVKKHNCKLVSLKATEL